MLKEEEKMVQAAERGAGEENRRRWALIYVETVTHWDDAC